MCQVIHVDELRHEAFELLEEDGFDRLATHSSAAQCEQTGEEDVEEFADFEMLELL